MSGSITRIVALSGFLLLAPSAPAGADIANCLAQPSLDGQWVGNDGGNYYVRTDGNTVWWVGVSGDSGNSWTNLFHGTRTGDAIIGEWVDVNGPMGKGSLMLHVGDNMHMDRTQASGSGFGGTNWRRGGCSEQAQEQPPQTQPQQPQKVHLFRDILRIQPPPPPPPPAPTRE